MSVMETEVHKANSTNSGIGNIRHILVPVDFSESAAAAAIHARQMARLTGATVTLLHVDQEAAKSDRDSIRSFFEERDWSTNPRTGAAVAQRLESILDGFQVRRMVLPGDPAERIAEYAERAEVDIVIMPTRGLGPVRRFLLGSVTAKVLHDVDCLVWTVLQEPLPERVDEKGELKHIVCAIDLGSASAGVIRWSAELAETFRASLTIVHASTQIEPVIGVVHDTEWSAHVAAILRKEVENLVTDAGVKAEIRLAEGEPAKAVTAVAADLGAEILVIGRPMSNRFLGRLRTHSYAIIRQSPCSVLSV
jgi:nucleotide-binding universal stress UspA family protein